LNSKVEWFGEAILLVDCFIMPKNHCFHRAQFCINMNNNIVQRHRLSFQFWRYFVLKREETLFLGPKPDKALYVACVRKAISIKIWSCLYNNVHINVIHLVKLFKVIRNLYVTSTNICNKLYVEAHFCTFDQGDCTRQKKWPRGLSS
jgi:hypothetical protein